MSELELGLQALGPELRFPEPPDLAPAVRRRIEEPPGRVPRRRALVLVLAALVVAVGAVLAVPPARSAILDFLGIGSAEIRLVDELPPVDAGPLVLGEPVSLERARGRAPWQMEPHLDDLGDPDAVFVVDGRPGTPVTFVWGEPERPRLLLTQVRGRFYFEKLVEADGGFVLTDVNQRSAAWIEGDPHVVFYRAEDGRNADLPGRLARNTLVWSRGPVTLRLEGDLSRETAERIARSVR